MKQYETSYVTLDNGNGLVGKFSTLGAGVRSLTLDGKLLILEFEDEQAYLGSTGFHGKTLARVAGRIPDTFMIGGKTYSVLGDGQHICLHGGCSESLTYRNFEAVKEEDENEVRVIFHYLSKDGEAGFPGNLDTKVTYSMPKDGTNTLKITCEAVSDKDTLVSFSNHMYWNVFNSESVNDYVLQVKASKIGTFKPGTLLVVGMEDVPSCYDFRTPAVLKDKLDQIEKEHPEIGTLDNTYVFDEDADDPKVIMDTEDIHLEVSTDFDSINFYVDSCLAPYRFTNGEFLTHALRRAIAIEPETFPLLSNIVLKAGDKYSHSMSFKIDRK